MNSVRVIQHICNLSIFALRAGVVIDLHSLLFVKIVTVITGVIVLDLICMSLYKVIQIENINI